MFKRRGLFVFTCILATSAVNALAQTSPFAGLWSGTIVVNEHGTCSNSSSTLTVVATCTGTITATIPWTGTIDSQGNFTLGTGAGTASCSDGRSETIPATSPSSEGQVPPNGALPVGDSCDPSAVLQFSLSPPRISGTYSCTNGGCNQQETISGSSGSQVSAPNSPGALSGLWWNPNESGWGIAFTQRRNIMFGAWYTYDSAGNPKWYVAPNCPLPSGDTGASGTCTGTLYQVTGPTFFGTAFNPSLDNIVSVGSLTVAFQDANSATMSYTVNGQGRTVPIIRQIFQSGTTPPAVDYTDLWWNPNESGWGMEIIHQYGVMFLAWYVYNASGNPVWYVASDCVVQGSSCTGSVYSTTGPPLGPSFNPNAVQVSTVGTITANFTDANNATITYTVNGVSATKNITRQLF